MSTCNTPGHELEAQQPLTVTVKRACELSGFGPTMIWAFLRDGRLEAIRVDGCRRTLVGYRSLVKLLTLSTEAPRRKRGRPRKAEQAQHAPTPPRRHGRPRKTAAQLQPETTAAT
jgi:hypothetical protein